MQRHPVSLSDVQKLVQRTDLLVYAPPAYGKTTFQTNRKNQLDISVFDTDDLDCPPDSPLEILLTNYHQLLLTLDYGLGIIFLPSEEQFRRGCEFRGLDYRSSWYDDLLLSVNQSSLTRSNIIITSGKPLIQYDSFIQQCFNALHDQSPLPDIPIVKDAPPITHTATKVLHHSGRVTTERVIITPGTNEQYTSTDNDTPAPEVSLPPSDFSLEIVNTTTTTQSPPTMETTLDSTSSGYPEPSSDDCFGCSNTDVSTTSCSWRNSLDVKSTTSLMKLKINGVTDQLSEPFLPMRHTALPVEGYYECWTTGNLVLMKRAQIRFYVSRYLFEKWKATNCLWLRR